MVRAKTGTLSRGHALAGTAVDRDGDAWSSSLVADRVDDPNTLAARDLLDDLAAAALGRLLPCAAHRRSALPRPA